MKTVKPSAHKIHQPSATNLGRPRLLIWSCLAALLLLAAAAPSTHAQSFAINWSKIAGGGSTSTGGVFAVSGTIGQHDASGPMTNGPFFMRGGFWTLLVAVQVVDAPTLTIAPAGPGQAKISWSPATPGFILQETLSVTAANWINSPSGAANPVTILAVPPMKFYRLIKP